MLGTKDVEDVTDFVRRYCAVETSEGAESTNGRFCFFQGQRRRGAKAARKPVAWGEFERTASEVLRRVRELASNGEGHVYLAAYEEGATSPSEEMKVSGSTDELQAADDDGPSDGSAVAALVHGVLSSNKLLREENREWRDRAFRGLDNALTEREQATAMAYQLALMAEGAQDAKMQAALEALGPTIEAVAPKIIDLLAKYVTGGPPAAAALPTEPGPRVVSLVGRMVDDARELARVVTADPSVATPDKVGPLYELVRQLAAPLGLTVNGYPEAGGAA